MEYFFTCACGIQLTLKKESLGKKVKCKDCNEINEIPINLKSSNDTSPVLEIKSQSEKTFLLASEIECPFCAESIPKFSFECPKCKEPLSDDLNFSISTEQSTLLFNSYFDSIKEEEKSLGPTKKNTSLGTIIFYCSLLFCAIAGTAAFISDSSFGIALVVIGIVPLIILFVYSQNDKKAINIQSQTNPIEFISQYFKSLKSNRAKYIYPAVAPIGKDTLKTKPISFNVIVNDTNHYDIRHLKGYTKYWESIYKVAGNYNRNAILKNVYIKEQYEDKVICSLTLEFSSYNKYLPILCVGGLLLGVIAIHLGTKKELKTINKTILKYNNKWYVAEGELQGKLDFATFNEGN